MSALGQKRTLEHLNPMSALPSKADIEPRSRDVCFVPKADICGSFDKRLGALLRPLSDRRNP
jgi:hypothetical protein